MKGREETQRKRSVGEGGRCVGWVGGCAGKVLFGRRILALNIVEETDSNTL